MRSSQVFFGLTLCVAGGFPDAQPLPAQAEPTWTHLFSFAGADEGLGRVVDVIHLSGDHVAVADGMALKVYVVDLRGRLVATVGGRGEGPGEFRSIGAIWSVGDTLMAWDPRNQRVTRFRLDGSVLDTHRPGAYGSGGEGRGALDWFAGGFADGSYAIGWLRVGRSGESGLSADSIVIGRFAADGSFLGVLAEASGMRRVHGRTGSGPFAFSPFPWGGTVGDTLIFTNGAEGSLLVVQAARPRRAVYRQVANAPERIPLRKAWDAVDEVVESDVEHHRSVTTVLPDRSLGDVPIHSQMFVDRSGRIWLKRYDPALDAFPHRSGRYSTGGVWRIIGTDLSDGATVRVPATFVPLDAEGAVVVGIRRDSWGVERIEAYRLEW